MDMKNTIVRCKCVDMSVDGQGICKDDGLVIFVKGLIVGEVADVKIISYKKNLAYGIIDKLIEVSKYRTESSCPVSYKCGGCDFRHIAYPFQLEIKKHLLENTFRHLNVKVLDVIGCDKPLNYRDKVQVPVNEHKIGFYRKFSNDIVEFDNCLLQSNLSNNILKDLKEYIINNRLDKDLRHILIKHGFGTNEIMIGLISRSLDSDFTSLVSDITTKYPEIKAIILNRNTRDDNVILGDEEKIIYGRGYIIDEFAGVKVKISLKSFYQVNYYQMLKLYEKIKEFGDFKGNERVLDLYSGIGTISLYLARYVKEISGVEVVEEAVINAKENVILNNFDNVSYYLDDASNNLDFYLQNKDVVIVDPPRKGLTQELINKLIEHKINKIIYVSCNPATLARDLELFKDEYDISNIQPVDMFPYTVHTECITKLTIKNKAL